MTLTFQADPVPHRELTPQQQLEYQSQRSFRNSRGETPASYLQRLEYRVRYYRFFLLPPLYVALIVYLVSHRNRYWPWVLSSLAVFALGSNFYPLFQVHYIAAVTGLFLLMSVEGLRRLTAWRIGRPIAALVIFFCAAHFLFWYSLHLFEDNQVSLAMRGYETWDAINHENPAQRILVNRQLARMPGQLLIFVHYSPQHIFQQEWVYNKPDIDASRIVWARDLGPAEDQQLISYYPRRAAWLLEPDLQPPRLSPYKPEATTETKAAPAPAVSPGKKPVLRFEDVK